MTLKWATEEVRSPARNGAGLGSTRGGAKNAKGSNPGGLQGEEKKKRGGGCGLENGLRLKRPRRDNWHPGPLPFKKGPNYQKGVLGKRGVKVISAELDSLHRPLAFFGKKFERNKRKAPKKRGKG